MKALTRINLIRIFERFSGWKDKISTIEQKLPRLMPAFSERFFPYAVMRNDILALSKDLESVMGEIEPRFLQLGEELQNAYRDAGRLEAVTKTSAESVGGGESSAGFLSEIDEQIQQSLSELQGYRSKISESQGNVNRSLELLGKLCKICRVIEKTGMTLNVIGLNIGVESSRNTEAGDMFAAFIVEIRQLSRRVSGISRSIFSDAGATRSDQMNANEEILKGLKTFEDLHSDAKRVVQMAVRDIYKIMDLSVKALEASNTRSGEISRQVGEVVVAIQFHDIARQKIEHIIESLDEVRNLCRNPLFIFGVKRGEALKKAHKIVQLQAIQLAEIIQEIRTAHDKCRDAFKALERLVEQLVEDIAVIETEKDEDRRIPGRIKALRKGLEQLEALLRQGVELEKQIKTTAEEVADTASHLSEHIDQVRGISMDLHLKALNAVVKSARLGDEGRVLEILAQEVSGLSRQSDDIVVRVVEILQSLVSLSLDLNLEELNADTENGGSHSVSVESSIRDLTENYNTFKTDTTSAVDSVYELKHRIRETGLRLGFMTDLAGKISVHLKRMARLAEQLSPYSAMYEGELDDQLEHVARRYTMRSERRLHRKYLNRSGEKQGRDAPEPSESQARLPGGTRGDWDNIDLFGEDDVSPPVRNRGGDPEDGNRDDIVLFADEEEASAERSGPLFGGGPAPSQAGEKENADRFPSEEETSVLPDRGERDDGAGNRDGADFFTDEEEENTERTGIRPESENRDTPHQEPEMPPEKNDEEKSDDLGDNVELF